MRLKLGQKILDSFRGKKGVRQSNLPSDCEILEIDGVNTIRYYVYDYENLADTVAKNKSVLFIDIGANEGQSAHYAYHYFRDVQVISYEPLKSCLHFLEEIKQKHPNYVYKNIALAAEGGTIDILENKGVSGLSSIYPLNNNYIYYGNTNDDLQAVIVKTEAHTINDEISYWNSFNKDLKILKIDTQGSELSILKSGEHYLKEGNIDIIMIEIITSNKYVGQAYYMDTINFIQSCGFEIFNIKPGYRIWNGVGIAPEGLSHGLADEFDFTFIHKKAKDLLVK